MKIKTPVRVQLEWGCWILSEVGGAEVARVPIERKNAKWTANELRDVLNAHDDLIAQRDELRVQRDTLVGACEALLDLAIFMSGSTDFSDGGRGREGWLKLKPAIDKGRAALSLVRGEKNQ